MQLAHDHHLNRLEAIRVMAILEKTIEHLNLLSMLGSDSLLDAPSDDEEVAKQNADDNPTSVVRNRTCFTISLVQRA